MKTTTRDEIVQFIEDNGVTTPKQLVAEFGISEQGIHRHLRKLVFDGTIKRLGWPPIVGYIVEKF